MVGIDKAQMTATGRVRLIYGVIVGVFWFVGAIAVRGRLLGDPDIWWHIKTGMWIWSHGGVPVTDPFSFTFAGQPWIAKEWLSQLVYAGAFGLAGWNGVLLVGALALGLGAALLYWVVSAWLTPALAAAMSLLSIFVTIPVITSRPYLLTLPIFILWANALFRAAKAGRAPNFLWLALIILWANLHAAFTLGILIAGFAFLDFLEQTRCANRQEIWRWLVFLALCPLVCFIHPYGYQPMLTTWMVVGPNEAVGQIYEWQPFNAKNGWVQVVPLLGCLLAALVSGFRLGFARSLLLVLLLYLFLIHLRYAFYLFPLLPVLVAAPMADQFPRISAAQWRQQALDRIELFMSKRFAALLATCALVFGGVAWLEMRMLPTAPSEKASASSAIAFAKAHGVTGYVFNDYNFGGSLIFNDIATFIDGRAEQLFLGTFAKEYMFGPSTEQEMSELLKQYDIRWTLLPPGDPRAALLEKMPGWRKIYSDKYAIIHQRQ